MSFSNSCHCTATICICRRHEPDPADRCFCDGTACICKGAFRRPTHFVVQPAESASEIIYHKVKRRHYRDGREYVVGAPVEHSRSTNKIKDQIVCRKRRPKTFATRKRRKGRR